MYYITKDNIINLTRGDYLKFPITMYTGNFPVRGQFKPGKGDYIYFALMFPHESFERALVKKEYTIDNLDEDGNLLVEIYPEDTMNLLPGTYYYEVKALYYLDDEDSKVEHIDTVVQKTRFNLVD